MEEAWAVPYFAPTSSEEALSILRDKAPRVVAGCTDIFPALKPGEAIENILDLSRVAEMHGITETEDGWRIGGAATWTDILNAPLPSAFDGLKLAAREVGSVQIQNRGTVAGNICNASPAADGVPPLLTLDATVEIASANGTRTLRLNQFITGVRQVDLNPGEIVTALFIPAVSNQTGSGFIKLGSRKHLVISIAMAAATVEMYGDQIAKASVAVGSCSPVAVRLPALETAFIGKTPGQIRTADLAPALFAPLSPISDVRGSAEYRLDVVPELCRRAVLQACGVAV
ncbi:MAG: xanthine dehydrogenase family protein subunit M [Silicimonas sp.]|nr:xanthine dehydrogenase family protein subunit M [Silicimonas sp.]